MQRRGSHPVYCHYGVLTLEFGPRSDGSVSQLVHLIVPDQARHPALS